MTQRMLTRFLPAHETNEGVVLADGTTVSDNVVLIIRFHPVGASPSPPPAQQRRVRGEAAERARPGLGKSAGHHLQPDGLVAFTVEAAAMAGALLAGADWIRGRRTQD
jgi:hypothetical protein